VGMTVYASVDPDCYKSIRNSHTFLLVYFVNSLSLLAVVLQFCICSC